MSDEWPRWASDECEEMRSREIIFEQVVLSLVFVDALLTVLYCTVLQYSTVGSLLFVDTAIIGNFRSWWSWRFDSDFFFEWRQRDFCSNCGTGGLALMSSFCAGRASTWHVWRERATLLINNKHYLSTINETAFSFYFSQQHQKHHNSNNRTASAEKC